MELRLFVADADEEASGAGRMRPLAALASVNGCQPQTGMEQRVLRRAAVPAAALVARGAWGSREVEASDGFGFFGFGLHVSFLFSLGRRGRRTAREASKVTNTPFKSWNYHLKPERLGLRSPAL